MIDKFALTAATVAVTAAAMAMTTTSSSRPLDGHMRELPKLAAQVPPPQSYYPLAVPLPLTYYPLATFPPALPVPALVPIEPQLPPPVLRTQPTVEVRSEKAPAYQAAPRRRFAPIRNFIRGIFGRPPLTLTR